MSNENNKEKESISYSDVIKNISYSQNEILHNIIELHNNGRPFFADITYSKGGFYKKYGDDKYDIPQPLLKFDIAPLFDDVIQIEPNGSLPMEDNSIDSIVIDLPFVIASTNAPSFKKLDEDNSNLIVKRFSSYYPIVELFKSYKHWLEEAYRVLQEGGICVFKAQATVSSGKQYMTPEFSWYVATKLGFYTVDQFFLLARHRLHSSKIKQQQHARKYSSTFYVFKKCNKNLNYFDF